MGWVDGGFRVTCDERVKLAGSVSQEGLLNIVEVCEHS